MGRIIQQNNGKTTVYVTGENLSALTPTNNTYYLGVDLTSGVFEKKNPNGVTVNLEVFTGGTVDGVTTFTNGLNADAVSATTYLNLPGDIYLTGGTYSAGTLTLTSSGFGNIVVTGFTSGSGGGMIDITLAQLITDIANGDIVAGSTYHITDRGIYLQGLDVDKVSVTGHRIMKIVESSLYTTSTGVLGVWNSTLTPTIGDKTIWGGKVWENINGNVGDSVDDATLDSEWSLIPTSSADYVDKVFGCEYDLVNDFVSKQWDERGNIFGVDFLLFSKFGFTHNPVDISDWGNNYIVMNDNWGIFNNSNVGGIFNNSNIGGISSNSNAGGIFNNSNAGGISYNSNIGGIFNNSNIGGVYYINNTTNNIFYNSLNGDIDTSIVGDITDPPIIVQVSPLGYGDTISIGANRGQNFQVFTTGSGTGTAIVGLLPTIPIGGTITVSDLGGNASTHNIQIDAGVGNTITEAGVASQTLTITSNNDSWVIRKITATQYLLISKI